jgi:hypothetical protein
MNTHRAKITAESLPRDVQACEALLRRHHEYNAELMARLPNINDFVAKGEAMINSDHVLKAEIAQKV